MRIKRVLIFSLVLIMVSGTVYGGSILIEAKGMYFFQPTDQDFKEIYANGTFMDWTCFGGEIGIELWKGIGIWAGGHYFKHDKGKLTFTEEPTKITITPFYGGIKLRLMTQRVANPYIGAGVGYFLYKEENTLGTVNGGDIGYIGQGGVIFKIGKFIIDLQVSYTYCKVKPLDIEANLGGIHGGVGIGFEL